MKRVLFAAGLAAVLAACTTPYGPPPAPPAGPAPSAEVFRPQDFAWSTVPGAARVDGLMNYMQGPVRYTCRDADVVLLPETPWTRRRMTILYGSPERSALPSATVRARTPSAPNGDYGGFVRRAKCDAADRFSFDRLPPGAWYAILVAKPVSGGAEQMAIMRRVVTRGARPTAVTLN